MARPKGKKRTKGMHTADSIVTAVRLHRNGMSIRKAASECNLAYPTLRRYILKNKELDIEEIKKTRLTPNYEVNKIFTEDQEGALKAYIKECALMFYGLTTKECRRIAYQMAIINKINIPESWKRDEMAGFEWLRSFRARHLDLSLKKPEPCSLARATSFNKENVKSFFDKLKTVMSRHVTFGNGCRVYNLDETATTTVQRPQKVIGPKGINVGKVTSGEKGTLVTTCCVINAVGHALPPVLIFPRKNYKDYMLAGAPSGSLGLATPSGWMNSELFLEVIKHFIKHTSASVENPALLIMDNHESHLSLDALNLAKECGVTILTLHPHTSAKLQPLDVGLYAPFKVYYNSAVESWLLRNPGKPLTIYNVAECVGIAYVKSMTPENIISAFKKTGIFPYNPNIFTEIDFLPSSVTDRPEYKPETVSNPADLKNKEISNGPTFPVENNYADADPQPDEHQSENIPEIFNRPTTPVGIHDPDPQPGCSGITKTFISPKEFLPPLKAGPRTTNRKPRRLGKSMIATDTPEKEAVAEERSKAKERQSKAKIVKRQVLTDKPQNLKRRKVKKMDNDSDSSEDGSLVLSSGSSDIDWFQKDNDEDYGEIPPLTTEFEPLPRDPAKDDYVLVIFQTKKADIIMLQKY